MTNRTHPDPERIREVMNAIVGRRKVDGRLKWVDMGSIMNPICGTPGCAAGEMMIGLTELGLAKTPHTYLFSHYADLFSQHIFHGEAYPLNTEPPWSGILETWANDNPDLWGNQDGDYMFSEGCAYSQKHDRFHPKIITDHWLDVADRIEAFERYGGVE